MLSVASTRTGPKSSAIIAAPGEKCGLAPKGRRLGRQRRTLVVARLDAVHEFGMGTGRHEGVPYGASLKNRSIVSSFSARSPVITAGAAEMSSTCSSVP